MVRYLIGDCIAGMKTLAAKSVQCCVTSPPYWAQRDYGHQGQIGMEKTPEDYLAKLLEVFAEVWRVLRDDGVLWLNIGDSYAASGKGGGGKLMAVRGGKWGHRKNLTGWRSPPAGYKQKDLVGIPWQLAITLRRAGWTLRRDVIWNKGSATEPTRRDRPSVSHEFVFLLSKGIRYWFDNSHLPHGTVWNIKPRGYDGHSAAFPLALAKICVLTGCPEGGTVLDPFGGAATTGVVCRDLGRDCILCELNPDYAAIGERRLLEPARVVKDGKSVGKRSVKAERASPGLFDGLER